MNDALKQLYNRFYTPLPMTEPEQEIEDCHKQLIERLEKPERKLVLRIMDNQNLIAEGQSMDSFYCGFKLAWELAYELNYFETDRHLFPAEEAERDVWFLCSQAYNAFRRIAISSSLNFSSLSSNIF
ncbi:MAG: DUF6809 family protein [Dysosmobacter sp.]|jgi:hypothetical protein|uniref:DUF6809 family protein n=1 Tax=Dysosmobacter sp. TaxID=2591382 RepID=UPI003D8EC801